jgi:pimeloyl-ACP methyl ester carboxylesterase
LLFAATHPERTRALILYAPLVKGTRSDDFPWSLAPEVQGMFLEQVPATWGSESMAKLHVSMLAPIGECPASGTYSRRSPNRLRRYADRRFSCLGRAETVRVAGCPATPMRSAASSACRNRLSSRPRSSTGCGSQGLRVEVRMDLVHQSFPLARHRHGDIDVQRGTDASDRPGHLCRVPSGFV